MADCGASYRDRPYLFAKISRSGYRSAVLVQNRYRLCWGGDGCVAWGQRLISDHCGIPVAQRRRDGATWGRAVRCFTFDENLSFDSVLADHGARACVRLVNEDQECLHFGPITNTCFFSVAKGSRWLVVFIVRGCEVVCLVHVVLGCCVEFIRSE